MTDALAPRQGSERISKEGVVADRKRVLEQLVRDNIRWMHALAQRLLGDRALAEDAVQDAFEAAFRGLAAFQGRSALKTWLHRITVNTALMKLRRLKRLAEQPIDDWLPEFDEVDCRIEAEWPAIASTESVVASEELRIAVAIRIAQLPESYRVVLQLRDMDGYTTLEVAELLGISENNVNVRLYRARAALKTLLEPVLRGSLDS